MKKSNRGKNQYSFLLEEGGKLDDRVITLRLEKNIRGALEKIPQGYRSDFLRQAIKEAVTEAGLLE